MGKTIGQPITAIHLGFFYCGTSPASHSGRTHSRKAHPTRKSDHRLSTVYCVLIETTRGHHTLFCQLHRNIWLWCGHVHAASSSHQNQEARLRSHLRQSRHLPHLRLIWFISNESFAHIYIHIICIYIVHNVYIYMMYHNNRTQYSRYISD